MPLKLVILTARRTSEAINARWAEIDLDAKFWTIPAERMKAKREHRVPLSDAAIKVLTVMQGRAEGEYVFAGGKSDKPLSSMAMLELLRRMKRTDLTVHGLRSTFRDWAAEMTNFPREVAEVEITPPRDRTDVALIEDVLGRASEAIEYLQNSEPLTATTMSR